MTLDKNAIKARIRAKVTELAANIGIEANDLADDEIIPATGLLDSAALLELVVWYEGEFDLSLKPEEVNIDNLGSVDAMANFAVARRPS